MKKIFLALGLGCLIVAVKGYAQNTTVTEHKTVSAFELGTQKGAMLKPTGTRKVTHISGLSEGKGPKKFTVKENDNPELEAAVDKLEKNLAELDSSVSQEGAKQEAPKTFKSEQKVEVEEDKEEVSLDDPF